MGVFVSIVAAAALISAPQGSLECAAWNPGDQGPAWAQHPAQHDGLMYECRPAHCSEPLDGDLCASGMIPD